MSDAIHNHGPIQSSTDGRDTASGDGAADGERQTRKPRRFGWLFEEWVFQAFLVVAVLVALVDGFSSVNHIPIA
jgi:hypothetical protein